MCNCFNYKIIGNGDYQSDLFELNFQTLDNWRVNLKKVDEMYVLYVR